MSEGRVTQFGPSGDVYRRPNALITAQTFSDPPLNTLPVELSGQADRYPGARTLAFRAHHLRLQKRTADAHAFNMEVVSTDITGSETFVHLKQGDLRWVMLTHGVQVFATGAPVTVYLEPADVMQFAADGAALTPAREAA